MAREVFIVDTNVVISGLIGSDEEAPPARILDVMLRGRLVYLMSDDLLSEYATVLRRPKLRSRHGLTTGEIDRLLSELVANAMWAEPVKVAKAPDAGDQHLWSLLESFPRTYLITGDGLLLDNPPDDASVISLRAFVETFGA